MRLLFVADPLETFKTYKDTTFAMMRAAEARGHALVACEPRDLVWQRGGRVEARVRSVALAAPSSAAWFVETADVHGHGNLIIFTDGSVSDLKTVIKR